MKSPTNAKDEGKRIRPYAIRIIVIKFVTDRYRTLVSVLEEDRMVGSDRFTVSNSLVSLISHLVDVSTSEYQHQRKLLHPTCEEAGFSYVECFFLLRTEIVFLIDSTVLFSETTVGEKGNHSLSNTSTRSSHCANSSIFNSYKNILLNFNYKQFWS